MRVRAPIAGALVVAALLAAGCSSDDEAASVTASVPASDSDPPTSSVASTGDAVTAFPATIEHALGSTTIATTPERVVVLGDFADLDSVLALGVTPVAFGFTDAFGTGLAPWQVAAGADQIDQFDAAGEIDVEQVAATDPDLIIGMTYLAEPIYDQLGDLAPTVAVPFDMTWQEQLALIGRAVGRSDRVADAEADVTDALAAGAALLEPYSDRTVMVGSYYGDSLYIQGEASSVTNLLRELGLTVATTTSEQMDQQSLENIPSLEQADVLVSFATDQQATHDAQDNPLWQALPAVTAGRYTALTGMDARAVSDGFNALSYRTVIDLLVDVIATTAEGGGTPLA